MIEDLESFQKYVRENPGGYVAVDATLLNKLIHAMASAAIVVDAWQAALEYGDEPGEAVENAIKNLSNDLKWIGLNMGGNNGL